MLQELYAAGAIEPPVSHIVVGAVGAVYAALVAYYVGSWARGRAKARAARHARTGVLREGRAQILARIAGGERLVRAPGDESDRVDVELPAFTLEAGGGPVRVEGGTRAVYHPHGDGNAPLRGGDYVEIAGELSKESEPTAEGYRGELRDRWVLRPRGTEGARLTIWRHARTQPHERRADMAVGGLVATLALLLFSTASLGGYLARLTLGETTEVRVSEIRELEDQRLLTLVPADEPDETLSVRVDAVRGSELRVGDSLPYRSVGGNGFVSSLGPDAGLGPGALVGAILFLVLAAAVWASIVAVREEG